MIDASFTINEFIAQLGSDAPVPGGGGAAGLVGAVGASLAQMTCSLAVGKKTYAENQDKIIELQDKLNNISKELLACIPADAEGFEPLTRAYKVPKDSPEKVSVMLTATLIACKVPMAIMQLCCDAIDLLDDVVAYGSKMAVSDAACGAIVLKSALQAASLNVFINTKSLSDRQQAMALNMACDMMLDDYVPKAQEIFDKVMSSLRD